MIVGDALGDVETWQLPIWLALWPDQAKAALKYRVERMPTARLNARTPVWPEAAPRGGLKFPVESAITGIEQCIGSMEDHVQGDIALACRQYYYATLDKQWLKRSGFPVMNGLATYYASRLREGADGLLHIYHTTGPDECQYTSSLHPWSFGLWHVSDRLLVTDNNNETDNAFGSALAIATLRGAHDLAADADAAPNVTYRALAARVHLPYDAARDYHVSVQPNLSPGLEVWQLNDRLLYSRSSMAGTTAARRMTAATG